MEIIKHELLDTGSSKNFHYYSLICGFDINPNNGGTARDMFMHIRSIIGSGAEIQDDIAIRVYKNDDSFGLVQYPSDSEDMAVSQYLFSVSAHNNQWTLETLSTAVGEATLSLKMLPRKGNVVLKWYQSLAAGMEFGIINSDASGYDMIDKWDIKLSKTIPTGVSDGSNGHLWIVPDQNGVIQYYYRENDTWQKITKDVVFDTNEPGAGEKYWFNPTGMIANIAGPNGEYSVEEYPIIKDSVDPAEIRAVHSPRGTVMYTSNNWKFTPVDGNMVYNEYNWFNNSGEPVNSKSFTFAEQNAALAGTTEATGGAVEIYNYTFAPENLIGTATALVFVDGDQRAYPGSEPGVIMVGTAPEYSSHFTTSDGSNGMQTFTPVNTTNSFISIPDIDDGFIAGDWQETVKPTTNASTIMYSTPGIVTGFGTGSNIYVQINDGNNAEIAFLDHEFTANQTIDTGVGLIVEVSEYTQDGADQEAAKLTVTIDNTLIMAGESGTLKITVRMTAADNGQNYTFTQNYFYDKNTGLDPIINGDADIQVQTLANTKHISGIEYITTGQQFDIRALDIDGLANDTFNATNLIDVNLGVFPISDFSVPRTDPGFTGLTNDYNIASVNWNSTTSINEADFIYIGSNNMTTTAKDTWNIGPKQFTIPNHLIDTVTESSTDLVENFTGESYRLKSDWSVWDSTSLLQAGEALVATRKLMVPSQLMTTVGATTSASDMTGYIPAGPDYSALTAPVTYKRKFTFTDQFQSFPSLVINFAGEFGIHANIHEAMTAGDIEIFMYREEDLTAGYQPDPALITNPVWLHAAFGGLPDNGATQTAAAAGVTISETSNGNEVSMSFGTRGLLRGFWLEIVINSVDIKLDSINVVE